MRMRNGSVGWVAGVAAMIALLCIGPGCGRPTLPSGPLGPRMKPAYSRLFRELVPHSEIATVGFYRDRDASKARQELSCDGFHCTLMANLERAEKRNRLCPVSEGTRHSAASGNAYDAHGMPVLEGSGCSMVYVGGGYVLGELHCATTLQHGSRKWQHEVLFGFDAPTIAANRLMLRFAPTGFESLGPAGPKRAGSPEREERFQTELRRCVEVTGPSTEETVEGLLMLRLDEDAQALLDEPQFGCRAPVLGEYVYSLNYPNGAPLMRSSGAVVQHSLEHVLIVHGLLIERGSSGAPIFAESDGALVGVVDGARHLTTYCAQGTDTCATEIVCGGECGVVRAAAMSKRLCERVDEIVQETTEKGR